MRGRGDWHAIALWRSARILNSSVVFAGTSLGINPAGSHGGRVATADLAADQEEQRVSAEECEQHMVLFRACQPHWAPLVQVLWCAALAVAL